MTFPFADDDAQAVPIHAVGAVLTDLPEPVARWLTSIGFKGDYGRIAPVPGDQGKLSAIALGIGAGDDPMVYGALAQNAPPARYRLPAGVIHDGARLAALGFGLSSYGFDRYRTKKSAARAQLVLPPDLDRTELVRILDAVGAVRDLINVPAEDMGPAELAAAAVSLAERHGAVGREVVGAALLADNWPLIHAVGRASSREPRLVDFTWGNADAPKVTLVGKGVCFDTGGLDLKDSPAMALMKKDMGGAAHALGLAEMIMSARLKVRLRVLLPLVENAVSGNAFRTSDIFRSRKGLTVEIGNTDAEGRLILADALAEADREAPDLLIDFATLTGAARVALGSELAPFYTDEDGLADDLLRHSRAERDPIWRMPLWRPYDRGLDSRIADLKSTQDGPMAGSVHAALFLRRFVDQTKSWVHFDIYAWSPETRPPKVQGGEAQAIRAVYSLLRERFGA